MEVKRIIIRRPVSDADKLRALTIVANIDMARFTQLISPDNHSHSLDDILFVTKTIAAMDNASKLFGFSSMTDFADFMKIYGVDALA